MQYCQRAGSQSVDRQICPTEKYQTGFVSTPDYCVPQNINDPLDPRLDSWITDFSQRPNSAIDFDWLNAIVGTGSANIGSSPKDELGRGQYIIEARETFFSSADGLDLGNPSNPLFSAAKKYRTTRHWPPIMTFIRSQRFQYANGMNGAHNIKTAKRIVGISAEDVALSFEALAHEGGDPVEIGRKSGGYLELSKRNIHETVGVLREKGLDITRTLKQNPAVLGRNNAELGRRIDICGRIVELLGVAMPTPMLLSEAPQWLSVGDVKLRVLARVLSERTLREDIPEEPARIRKIAVLPLESILSSIIQEGTLKTAAAERESLMRPVTNRQSKLTEQLSHKDNLDLLGEKIVTSYVAYSQKVSMSEARKIAYDMFYKAA